MKRVLKYCPIALLLLCPLISMGQTEMFYDDFSGDLAKWQELGNVGTPQVADGELRLEWGYAPNWFVTNDTFNFGSEALQFDFTFVEGGYQATANYKQNYIQPLLGANDLESDNGAVRARFSADFFELERYNADGTWSDIPFTSDEENLTVDPGDRVRFEIDSTGQKGVMYVNGESAIAFETNEILSGSIGFRVVTDSRNVIVDDVYFAQIDGGGAETVILDDSFERADVGADWVNETLADDSSPGPLLAFIENGQLHLTSDGSGDAWLRIDADVTFEGGTTVFEYTFVDYIGDNTYRPSPVLGVKAYESGITSGVILIDNGSGVNYGLVDGGWAQGQASEIGGNRNGMRVQIVVNPGGQSGHIVRDGIEGINFFNIGPTFSGGFAFRLIAGRDITLDDLFIYALEPDGGKTTLYEDNYNRDELGDDWILEALTPDAPPGAVFIEMGDFDGDGDNEVLFDHDGSLDDEWIRLQSDLPFGGDKPVVIEMTVVEFIDYASVVIGTNEFNSELYGPILLDNMESPWVMDTRGGNVWVRPGPVGGSNISLKVNADGRSGSFLVNDVIIRDWEFAEGEAPIPVGAVGFEDPFDSPHTNTVPPAEPDTVATAVYDDVRVTAVEDTSVNNWMIH